MVCKKIKRYLIEYIDGILDSKDAQIVEDHLSSCEICRKETEVIQTLWIKLDDIPQEEPTHNLKINIDNMIASFKSGVAEVGQKSSKKNFVFRRWALVSPLTKSRITRLSAATAVVFAVIIGTTIFNKSELTATAQDVLSDAVNATAGIESIHIKGHIRTSPGSLVSNFDLNHDFVPVEVWKKIDQKGNPKWRLETTGSLVITDGKTATIFNTVKNSVYKYDENGYPYFNSWMMRLLDVHEVLDIELKQAKDNPFQQIRLIHKGINGKDKIVLEVNAWANTPPGDDPFKNEILISSDHMKIYQFDTDTKLLEGLKIYIIDNGQEVLVFETTDIDYNARIDDSVFVPDLPYDVEWSRTGPQILSDNDKYAKMTPKEVAAAFLDAASKEDWDEMLKLGDADGISQKDKDKLAGLEVIYLGEPVKFQAESGPLYWIISYKIKLKNGDIREDRLGLSNDNKAKRYVVLGTP